MANTPTKKLILEDGIHRNSSTNWNFAVERSKSTHNNVEKTNADIEEIKATLRISFVLVSLINIIVTAPKSGSRIKISNKLDSNIFINKLEAKSN